MRAATELLLKAGAQTLDPTRSITLDRYTNNALMVDMYTYLTGRDRVVSRWVALRVKEMDEIARERIENVDPLTDPNIVGAERAHMGRVGAYSIEKLLDWINGDRNRRWFSEDCKREIAKE